MAVGETFEIKGYKGHSDERNRIAIRGGNSGGLVGYVKEEISTVITTTETATKEVLCLGVRGKEAAQIHPYFGFIYSAPNS